MNASKESLEQYKDENFLLFFELNDKSYFSTIITMTYFAFTTLSTVGLGDFHPRGDIERMIGAIIMLFGVIVTSYIAESITNMIKKIKALRKDHEEDLALSTFLGTINHFNEGNQNKIYQDQLKDYFSYRWKENRNFAVSTWNDELLYNQLPENIQRKLFFEYLYSDILDSYTDFF